MSKQNKLGKLTQLVSSSGRTSYGGGGKGDGDRHRQFYTDEGRQLYGRRVRVKKGHERVGQVGSVVDIDDLDASYAPESWEGERTGPRGEKVKVRIEGGDQRHVRRPVPGREQGDDLRRTARDRRRRR